MKFITINAILKFQEKNFLRSFSNESWDGGKTGGKLGKND